MVRDYTNTKKQKDWIVIYVGQSLNPVLLQCYNQSAIPGVTIANERPPANTNILVELIRRLEDANPTLSAREVSLLVLQK